MNKDKEVEAYKSGNLPPEEQTKYESLRRGLEKPLRQRNGPDRWHNGAKETEKIIVYYLPLQPVIRL